MSNYYRHLIQANAPTTTDPLISYYKFDETTGSIAIDSKGTNNGKIYGATLGVPGKQGTAFSFDGVNDYIDLSSLDGSFNGVSFSVGCWFKNTQANESFRFIQNRGQGALGSVRGFTLGAYGDIYNFHWGNCGVDDGQGNAMSFIENEVIETDGNWHFIVMTWNTNEGRLRFYLDNILKGEKINTKLINVDLTGLGTLFGKSNQNQQYLKGEADELFFYQKELTANKVSQLYNNGNGTTI